MSAQVNWKGADELRSLLVPLATISRHPRNARRGDVALVMESLERFGQTKPIVLHTYSSEDEPWIVAGNHTYMAAEQAGWTHIAVTTPDLSDDEADQYLHMDNRSSDVSVYDDAALISSLDDLKDRGLLEGTGYDDAALSLMIEEANARSEAELASPQGGLQDFGGDSRPAGEAGDLRSLILSLTPAAYEALSKRLKALQKEYGTEDAGATIVMAMDNEFERTWNRSKPKVEVPEAADEVPAAPKKAKTKVGEIVELGPHRLLCGDCRDAGDVAKLMGDHTAQVLWTDPPYGVSYVGKTKEELTIQGDGKDGLLPLLLAAFAAVAPALDPTAPFYIAAPAGPLGLVFRQALEESQWRFHEALVWAKDVFVLGHSDYHYKHEDVLYGYLPGDGSKGRPGRGRHAGSKWRGDNAQDTLFEIARPKRSEEHPTMKPVELIASMLPNSIQAGEIVLDPFAGSGSTMIAAELVGARAFMIEIDPIYCDVIRKRHADFVAAELARMAEAA